MANASHGYTLGNVVNAPGAFGVEKKCGRWQVPDGSVVDEANKPRELDVP